MAKIYDDLTGDYKSQFYAYDSAEFQTLDLKVSCKYFDQISRTSLRAMIAEHPDAKLFPDFGLQRLPEEVQRWAFVLGGRCVMRSVNSMGSK